MAATQPRYDAIVVGARCAGTTVATVMAHAGRRVLLVDRDEFPSDTVSTHQLFPNSLALLDRARCGRPAPVHSPAPPGRVLRGASSGTPSPVASRRSAGTTAPARSVGSPSTRLPSTPPSRSGWRLGWVPRCHRSSGPAPPVTRCAASSSTPVSRCTPPGSSAPTAGHRSSPAVSGCRRRGNDAARCRCSSRYWEGLPDSGWCQVDVQSRLSLMSSPCEDGIHLLMVAGPADLTRGSATQREEAYLRRPATVPHGAQPAPARQCETGLPPRRGPGDDVARLRPARHRPGVGPRRRRRPVQAPGDGPGHR